MKKSGLIIGAIALLVVVAGVVVLTNKPNTTKMSSNSTSPSAGDSSNANKTSPSADSSNQVSQAENTISYTNNGFSPASLTVKSGTTITIRNDSSGLLQFNSDPHPQHTGDPELNVGSISHGASKTVKVTKSGSHGYHNHINPDQTGTLIVQ